VSHTVFNTEIVPTTCNSHVQSEISPKGYNSKAQGKRSVTLGNPRQTNTNPEWVEQQARPM